MHADFGPAMRSHLLRDALTAHCVELSHIRPYVLNDNPYSEAWVKTLKLCAVFAERLVSIADAREFVDWFNHDHRQSGVGLHSAVDVHGVLTTEVENAVGRCQTLERSVPSMKVVIV